MRSILVGVGLLLSSVPAFADGLFVWRNEQADIREPEHEVRAFFERIAPVNNAHKIAKPLFIVQGANDPRVPQAEAEQMASTVKRNGSPVWCMLAKNEGHGYRRKENSDDMFGASVMFVKRDLLGEEVTAAGW